MQPPWNWPPERKQRWSFIPPQFLGHATQMGIKLGRQGSSIWPWSSCTVTCTWLLYLSKKNLNIKKMIQTQQRPSQLLSLSACLYLWTSDDFSFVHFQSLESHVPPLQRFDDPSGPGVYNYLVAMTSLVVLFLLFGKPNVFNSFKQHKTKADHDCLVTILMITVNIILSYVMLCMFELCLLHSTASCTSPTTKHFQESNPGLQHSRINKLE